MAKKNELDRIIIKRNVLSTPYTSADARDVSLSIHTLRHRFHRRGPSLNRATQYKVLPGEYEISAAKNHNLAKQEARIMRLKLSKTLGFTAVEAVTAKGSVGLVPDAETKDKIGREQRKVLNALYLHQNPLIFPLLHVTRGPVDPVLAADLADAFNEDIQNFPELFQLTLGEIAVKIRHPQPDSATHTR